MTVDVDVVVVNDDLVEVRPGHGIVIKITSDGVTCPKLDDAAALDALAGGAGASVVVAVRRVMDALTEAGPSPLHPVDTAHMIARAVAAECAPRYTGTRRTLQRLATDQGAR